MIDDVYNQGDDALGNIAEIKIESFELFANTWIDRLKFRTTKITIPNFEKGIYEVAWKSQKFEKPDGKDNTAKTFDTEFRVDKYYTVWKAIMAWWQYIMNSDTGAIAEDVGAVLSKSNIRTSSIKVSTVDTLGNTTNDGFDFQRVWPKTVTGFSYDNTSGDPLMCTVTWSFVKMIPLF